MEVNREFKIPILRRPKSSRIYEDLQQTAHILLALVDGLSETNFRQILWHPPLLS